MGISNAIGYAKFYSRSQDAVIRVYDATGNVIETHEHAGDFKRVVKFFWSRRVDRAILTCSLQPVSIMKNSCLRFIRCLSRRKAEIGETDFVEL
jgi:hypothetical protein